MITEHNSNIGRQEDMPTGPPTPLACVRLMEVEQPPNVVPMVAEPASVQPQADVFSDLKITQYQTV